MKTYKETQIKKQNYKSLFSVLSILVVPMLFVNTASAKLCGKPESEMAHRNEVIKQKCGAGITWDLTEFVSDNSICPSRKQGLELIEKVITNICEKQSDLLKSKIKTIRVKGLVEKEMKYNMKGTTFLAEVTLDEAYVLTQWSQEEEKLENFIRTTAGVNKIVEVPTIKPVVKSETQIKNEKFYEQRNKINEKIKTAVEKFKSEVATIMARPGNSPDDFNKKQSDVNKAQAEFDKLKQQYEKELEELKKNK